jgi:oligopeptide/dipeptide ABC transporter ATP-binding protein
VSGLLQVHNLTVEFTTAQGWFAAVRDVSFHIAAGEVLGLVGESGSGKSVTALAMLRLLPPQARVLGSVRFRDTELAALSKDEMRRIRGAGLSMIFQEPMTALNPVMRVGDQIAEAVLAHRESQGRPLSKSEAWGRAVEALRTVSIADADRRARDYPHQLSGGQRQRVMIAMAVVNRPALLIADEPTTALDVTIQAQVLELLNELRQKFGLAMLFIAGSLIEMGTAREVFLRPVHPYTRGLLHAVPTLHTRRDQPLETIEGSVPTISDLPPGCRFEPRCSWRIPACAEALPPLVEVAPGHLARCPVLAAEVH